MLHGEKPRPLGASDRVTRLLRCTSPELARLGLKLISGSKQCAIEKACLDVVGTIVDTKMKNVTFSG